MKDEVRAYLDLARESVSVARLLLEKGYLRVAASRAYYAMFYAAQALLLHRGESYSRHSGVIAAFGRRFAKTGEMDPKYHRWLIDAQDLRTTSDYAALEGPNFDEAREVLSQAEEFLKAGQDFLAKRSMEE